MANDWASVVVKLHAHRRVCWSHSRVLVVITLSLYIWIYSLVHSLDIYCI